MTEKLGTCKKQNKLVPNEESVDLMEATLLHKMSCQQVMANHELFWLLQLLLKAVRHSIRQTILTPPGLSGYPLRSQV